MENIVAAAVIDFVQQWGGGIRVSIEATAREEIKTKAGRKEHPAEDAAEGNDR